MQPQADHFVTSREGLHAALLDYAHAPGKYPVGQRRPAVLFASVREILQIAQGRASENTSLRDAARFFINGAMLHAGTDHYALLGLPRNADVAALKDHYRLLMRLIHPDFAGNDMPRWPADSAVRVNMAYDVLSSPVRRREYDATLPSEAPRAQPARQEQRRTDTPRRVAAGTVSRSGYKTIVVVCAAAGGLVLGALFMTSRDGVHLVQRQTRPQEPVPAPEIAPAPVVAIMEPLSLPKRALRIFLPEPTLEIAQPDAKPLPVAPTPAPIPAPALAAAAAAPASPSPPASSPPPPAPRPALVAGLSLEEAQPLLAVLLQHLESGRGERLVNMLEHEARGHPGAQALSRHYERLVDGMRPVRLSHVEFKAEPADGRLLVTGHIGLQGGEQSSPSKKIVVRAEFASRAGNIVMIGLSGEPGN